MLKYQKTIRRRAKNVVPDNEILKNGQTYSKIDGSTYKNIKKRLDVVQKMELQTTKCQKMIRRRPKIKQIVQKRLDGEQS